MRRPPLIPRSSLRPQLTASAVSFAAELPSAVPADAGSGESSLGSTSGERSDLAGGALLAVALGAAALVAAALLAARLAAGLLTADLLVADLALARVAVARLARGVRLTAALLLLPAADPALAVLAELSPSAAAAALTAVDSLCSDGLSSVSPGSLSETAGVVVVVAASDLAGVASTRLSVLSAPATTTEFFLSVVIVVYNVARAMPVISSSSRTLNGDLAVRASTISCTLAPRLAFLRRRPRCPDATGLAVDLAFFAPPRPRRTLCSSRSVSYSSSSGFKFASFVSMSLRSSLMLGSDSTDARAMVVAVLHQCQWDRVVLNRIGQSAADARRSNAVHEVGHRRSTRRRLTFGADGAIETQAQRIWLLVRELGEQAILRQASRRLPARSATSSRSACGCKRRVLPISIGTVLVRIFESTDWSELGMSISRRIRQSPHHRPMLLTASVAALIVWLFAAASAADARTLYVSTGGSGSASCDEPQTPCTPEQAINGQARDDDEVIVSPGSYTVAAPLVARDHVVVRGVDGQPRPVFVNDGSGSTTLPAPEGNGGSIYSEVTLALAGQSSAKHLGVTQSGRRGIALRIEGNQADQVVALATGNFSSAVYLGDGALLANSIAFASGEAGTAARVDSVTAYLRNVLALAPNAGGSALDVAGGGWCYSISCPGAVPGTADVKSSILRGGLADASMTTTGYDGTSATLRIAHSNFRPNRLFREIETGIFLDDGGNQSTEPLFVDSQSGNYLPAEHSPTIDAGASDSWSRLGGDLAGAARVTGNSIDIGPFEYTPSGSGDPGTPDPGTSDPPLHPTLPSPPLTAPPLPPGPPVFMPASPSPTAPSTFKPTVKLQTFNVARLRRGAVTIRVHCSSWSACRGHLTLSVGKRTIATAAYRVPGRRTTVVRAKTTTAVTKLARSRRFKGRLLVTGPRGAPAVGRAVTLIT